MNARSNLQTQPLAVASISSEFVIDENKLEGTAKSRLSLATG
jgi:hypothetical protein